MPLRLRLRVVHYFERISRQWANLQCDAVEVATFVGSVVQIIIGHQAFNAGGIPTHSDNRENESTSGSDNWHHSHLALEVGKQRKLSPRLLLISFIEKLNSTQITCKLHAYGMSWLDVVKTG